MNNRKQSLVICLLFLLCSVFLSACLGGSSTTNSAEGDENVVQLKYTYWGGPLEKESVENLIKEFNETHPTIQVKGQQISEAYVEKLNTMASSNTLPDIGMFPEPSVASWAENGQLVDLSEYFENGSIGEKLEYSKFQFGNGPVVGSGVANEVISIYYNKEIFDEANIPYPPTNGEEAWTWEEFVNIAKQLTVDKTGKHPGEPGFDPKNIKTYGLNNFTWLYEVFLYSNGGAVVSEGGKEILLNNPESIEALQAIADLMYVHHVMPKPSELSTIPTTDTALLTKRVAMSIDGQWSLQALGQAKVEKDLALGIGVLPKFKEPVTTNFGAPIVIFNTEHSEKYRDETVEFLEYIMDPENSLVLIQDGLWMPNDLKWYEDPELISKWTDTEIHPPEYQEAVIDWGKNYVRQNPDNYWTDRTDAAEIINPALDQLWNNKKSAEEVVNEIMPKLKQELGDKYSY